MGSSAKVRRNAREFAGRTAHATRRGNARGAVLLLVIAALAILTVLAVELAVRAKADVTRSARGAREATFRRILDSGVEIARTLLSKRNAAEGYDGWGFGWEREVRLELGPGESVSVRVEDESGKLNILRAAGSDEAGARARAALGRLFERLDKAYPFQKWQEIGAAAMKRAAESAKGGEPLQTLDGLREAGISRELVFGSFKPDPGRPQVALCDYLTVFGDGKANVNTAPDAVMFSLSEEWDEALAGRIVRRRGARSAEESLGVKPFREVRELDAVEGMLRKDERGAVIANLLVKVQDSIGVQSACFSARILAEAGDRSREAWAFFEQSGGVMKLVAFEEIEP